MTSFIALIRKWRKEKRDYKLYRARIKKLPPEYQIVIKRIEEYLWNYALGSSMLDVLYDLADMFEEGAHEHRDVLSVTGKDVGAFCDDLIAQIQDDTWTGQRRNKLNKSIYEKLGREHEHHE